MDALQKALEEAVGKALPKVQGDLLQKRLTEADRFEDEVKEQNEIIRDNTKQMLALTKERDEAMTKLANIQDREAKVTKGEQDIKARELTCEDAERNHKMALLEQKVELIEGSRQDIFNLADSVFRNRTVQQAVHTNTYQPMVQSGQYDANGNPMFRPGDMSDTQITKKEVIQEDTPKKASDMNSSEDKPKTEE
jgi:hypothetical protein